MCEENLVLQRITELGYESIYQFNKINELTLGESHDIIVGKRSPLTETLEWRPTSAKIADVFGVTPNELWPDLQRQTAIEKNWRAVVIAEEETAGVDIQDPIDLTFRMEMNRVIEKLLVTVTPREEQVLRLRFGIAPHNQSYTLAEVGLMFEVSANRIRQIECHALRKMRHPDRAKKLKPFALDSGVCDLRTGKEKREDRTM